MIGILGLSIIFSSPVPLAVYYEYRRDKNAKEARQQEEEARRKDTTLSSAAVDEWEASLNKQKPIK